MPKADKHFLSNVADYRNILKSLQSGFLWSNFCRISHLLPALLSAIYRVKVSYCVAGAEKKANVPDDVIPLGKKSSLTAGMGLKPRSSSGASPQKINNQTSVTNGRLQRLEAELTREIKLQVESSNLY